MWGRDYLCSRGIGDGAREFVAQFDSGRSGRLWVHGVGVLEGKGSVTVHNWGREVTVMIMCKRAIIKRSVSSIFTDYVCIMYSIGLSLD